MFRSCLALSSVNLTYCKSRLQLVNLELSRKIQHHTWFLAHSQQHSQPSTLLRSLLIVPGAAIHIGQEVKLADLLKFGPNFEVTLSDFCHQTWHQVSAWWVFLNNFTPTFADTVDQKKLWITLEIRTWTLTCCQNAVCALKSGAISVVASHDQRSSFVTKTTSFPHTLNIIMNSSWGLLLSALCHFCEFPPLPSSSLRKGAITNSQNNWTASLKQHFTLGNQNP